MSGRSTKPKKPLNTDSSLQKQETLASDALPDGGVAIFVRRPVLAIVLGLLIVVAGLAAIYGAEIRELPDVDSPVVTVSTDFTGASPETIDRELTALIEGAAARVSGVKSISSSSSFGRSRVTVEFNGSVDLNVAASDLRDAISRVSRDMPDGADDPRIVKADSDAQAVLRLAVTSESMSVQDMTILVEDEVVDRLSAVAGVADVSIYGDRNKIFRIDIDPARMAALGLTVADIRNALVSLAFDVPAGSLTSNTQDIVVRATADVKTPADFESIFIKGKIQVGDVATVTFGPDPGDSSLRANGKTGIGLGIIRQAQSNTLDISKGVRNAAIQIQKILPEGVNIRVTSDDATFISGAIEEVVRSLLLAVLIVVTVIYLFLLDWRATLIPAVTLPISLIGTIAAIYLVGFSVNILTLLALVLATGMVVDDAIVVLENIVRRRNQGMGIRAAAVIGTREVFFAVITTTATLIAVFIPLSFLPGQAGGLFREFGFVLAFAVTLSGIIALSICPMLASRFVKPLNQSRTTESKPTVLQSLGRWLVKLYLQLLHRALQAPLVVLMVSVLFGVSAWLILPGIPQELTPREDRAVALMSISAPQGVSLEYTAARMRQIEQLIEPLRNTGEVENVFSIAGTGGRSNSGFVVLTLAPWAERQRSQNEIVGQLNGLVSSVPGVRAFAIQPNSLGIRGAGNGLQFAIVGSSYEQMGDAAQKLVQALEDDNRFTGVRLSYETTQPQLSVSIDRARASDLGIEISGLAQAMQAQLDGTNVGSVFIDDRAFPVKLISTTNPINDPTDLENIYLKAGDGRMVPMSTIAILEEKAVSPSLNRESQLRAVSITTGLSSGMALGEAYGVVEQLAEPLLPEGSRIIPLAEAATLEKSTSDILVVFGVAIIVVLLVLSAQFESFVSALIIMATVPMGLACAIFALLLTGGSFNVYSQIGLVLLVGVMAKNGILIVEFANQLRNKGYDIREAIEQACAIRLRPVLMTMISTVLGALPLVLAFGAGAEARSALGWIIVGGLGMATVFTLFLTPVAYMILARFSRPTIEEEQRLAREMAEASRHGT
jgi:HAE1 family hydrophobic/amphiphilic exporter-1